MTSTILWHLTTTMKIWNWIIFISQHIFSLDSVVVDLETEWEDTEDNSIVGRTMRVDSRVEERGTGAKSLFWHISHAFFSVHSIWCYHIDILADDLIYCYLFDLANLHDKIFTLNYCNIKNHILHVNFFFFPYLGDQVSTIPHICAVRADLSLYSRLDSPLSMEILITHLFTPLFSHTFSSSVQSISIFRSEWIAFFFSSHWSHLSLPASFPITIVIRIQIMNFHIRFHFQAL